MSQDDDLKEMRDLVTETLTATGVLGKLEAQLRAHIYLALEDEEVFKEKVTTVQKPLKDFLKTNKGLLAVSLMREFLEFFKLEFTAMVFDREINANIDFKYEGRSKLTDDLNMIDSDGKLPLLSHVIAQYSNDNNKPNKTDITETSPVRKVEIIEKSQNKKEDEKFVDKTKGDELISNMFNGHKDELLIDTTLSSIMNNSSVLNETDRRQSGSILTSLGGLPPLSGQNKLNITDRKQVTSGLKDLLDFVPDNNANNFKDVFMSSTNDKRKYENKVDSPENSEIEEDISNHSSSNADPNTADLTISRETCSADYSEGLL